MSTLRITTGEASAAAGSRRALAAAAVVYVAAWLVGLATAPAAPDADATDATIHAFYADNSSAALLQATLVHFIAGVALAVFVVAVAGRLPVPADDRARTVFLVAGLTAAGVSLLQFTCEVVLDRHAATSDDASMSATLFHAVNLADTVKLLLLAVAIGAATRAATGARVLPSWLRVLGLATVPALVLGGAAFVVPSDILSAILALSLLLLLAWVAATAVVLARDRDAPEPGRAIA